MRIPGGTRIRASSRARKNAAARLTSGWSGVEGRSDALDPDRAGQAHLRAHVPDRDLEELVEHHLGPPSHHAVDLAQIRHAPAHVLERAAVDLLVGDVLDLGAAP